MMPEDWEKINPNDWLGAFGYRLVPVVTLSRVEPRPMSAFVVDRETMNYMDKLWCSEIGIKI